MDPTFESKLLSSTAALQHELQQLVSSSSSSISPSNDSSFVYRAQVLRALLSQVPTDIIRSSAPSCVEEAQRVLLKSLLTFTSSKKSPHDGSDVANDDGLQSDAEQQPRQQQSRTLPSVNSQSVLCWDDVGGWSRLPQAEHTTLSVSDVEEELHDDDAVPLVLYRKRRCCVVDCHPHLKPTAVAMQPTTLESVSIRNGDDSPKPPPPPTSSSWTTAVEFDFSTDAALISTASVGPSAKQQDGRTAAAVTTTQKSASASTNKSNNNNKHNNPDMVLEEIKQQLSSIRHSASEVTNRVHSEGAVLDRNAALLTAAIDQTKRQSRVMDDELLGARARAAPGWVWALSKYVPGIVTLWSMLIAPIWQLVKQALAMAMILGMTWVALTMMLMLPKAYIYATTV